MGVNKKGVDGGVVRLASKNIKKSVKFIIMMI